MTNLKSIKKQKYYFAAQVLITKTIVFPIVMYRSEGWIINKVEHWKIDAFKLWYWKRLLRGSWDSKEIKLVNPKINHSWIFPRRADAEAEAPILWSPNAKKYSLEKTQILHKLEAKSTSG